MQTRGPFAFLTWSDVPTGATTSPQLTQRSTPEPRSAHTELISLERCDKVLPAIVRSFGRIRSRARREHSPGTCRRLLLSFRDTSRYKVLASHTAPLPTDLPDPLRVRYACGGVHWRRWLPRLVVVSNRVAVPDPTGKGAAGGLAVAVREAFQTHGGLWFGWSGKGPYAHERSGCEAPTAWRQPVDWPEPSPPACGAGSKHRKHPEIRSSPQISAQRCRQKVGMRERLIIVRVCYGSLAKFLVHDPAEPRIVSRLHGP